MKITFSFMSFHLHMTICLINHFLKKPFHSLNKKRWAVKKGRVEERVEERVEGRVEEPIESINKVYSGNAVNIINLN